ncbi:restriction endonuclease subunit S [Enterococcus faecium]|uniref:restriction endonuclease subunit S n=1 Tax=Enterococcus faecium TaxID=1352 RepID=UPI001786475A|nr:restriction endonuclease subunit S [Enterococcus faecium]MBD9740476.1 restriction endonuclease subunit S [Enterococcus faecium]MBD9742703.1 restriction endonuclease subunit S [Enterococcus faecium]MBD9754773.1 restriction endonuclease subunit S [Enterococcus faecium]MBD9800444.1 restriction endonuclease subunit S [Enterococcus faecium]MBD9804699.1 restriction endonuclease subunit S [Enterococcus faecium]
MKYKKVKLKDIIFFNPKETIKKNQLAKKIPMDALIPFTRKVGYYEVKEFNSGTKFRNNDTLMARITPCLENGKTAYVNILNEDEIAFGSTEYFVLRADENYILPKYLYYISISDKLRNVAIKSMTGTSGRQRAQKESILDFEIELPSISIQKKVLSILDSIDSKIELNNQIISNLEELASTLFKRWFVEFEFPDENGNPYKSSGGKMVYSELGEIPEEWEIIKLSDLVVQIKETFNPNKTEVEKVNHFSIPNFDSKKFPVIEDVNTIKSNKTKITDFTVLFSKMNPNFERVWLTELNKSYLNVCSPEFIALDCKNINLQTYTYFLCKSTAFNRFLVNNATGSTGSRQRIKPSIAMGFKFVGAVDLINKYGEICSGISEQIMNLRNQIENLKEMRDALLPKLLSGEIELPEDEEV